MQRLCSPAGRAVHVPVRKPEAQCKGPMAALVRQCSDKAHGNVTQAKVGMCCFFVLWALYRHCRASAATSLLSCKWLRDQGRWSDWGELQATLSLKCFSAHHVNTVCRIASLP